MKSRWILRLVVGILSMVLLLYFAICAGNVWVVHLLIKLAFGWIEFLAVNLKGMTVNWSLIGGALLTFP